MCHHPPMGVQWRVVLPWVGIGAMVVVLPFYLASGLLAPFWAVALLMTCWMLFVYLGLRLRRSRPWLVLFLPVVAFAWWFLVLSAGEAWLGWTA